MHQRRALHLRAVRPAAPDGTVTGHPGAGLAAAQIDPAGAAGRPAGHRAHRVAARLLGRAHAARWPKTDGHPGAGGDPPDPQSGQRGPLLRPHRPGGRAGRRRWWPRLWPDGSPDRWWPPSTTTGRIAVGRPRRHRRRWDPTRSPSSPSWPTRSTPWAANLAPGPRPGAPVPPVGLPRTAHAAHLDPRLRRGRARRRDRRPPVPRPRSSAPRPGDWSGWSRTCSTWPDSTPTGSPSTCAPSTPPTGRAPGGRRLPAPGGRARASASIVAPGSDVSRPVSADSDRLGQIWPTWWRTPRRSPPAGWWSGWTADRGRCRPVGGRRRAGHPGRPADPGIRTPLHDGPCTGRPQGFGSRARHRGRAGSRHGR